MKYAEAKRILSKGGRAYFVKHGDRHDKWFSTVTHKHFVLSRHDNKEVPAGTLHEIELRSGIPLQAKPGGAKPRS